MPKASQEQLDAFGRALAASLMDSGVSRRELADTLEVTTQAVDNYITGNREPDLRTVQAIEEALDARGQLIVYLGYDGVQAAASTSDGTTLEELRREDPEEYARLMALAAKSVAKARRRRRG